MSEPDARLQNAIARYGLASNEEWRTLLNHFDYQSGFAFVVVLVPGPDGVAPCRAELERHLAASGRRVLDISPATGEELKQIAGPLLDLKVDADVGAVWMAAATTEASPDYPEWAAAWREGVARLNQFRNLLQRQIPCTLVFVGATWVQPIIRTMAPDLWSVRSKVARIAPIPLHLDRPADWAPPPDRPVDPNAPDPEFALRQAQALRDKPGQELTLARILYRAGQGWFARREFEKAIEAFQDSASLQERFGAPLPDRAKTELGLARSLERRSSPAKSLDHYEEAIGLLRQSREKSGLAEALVRKGDLESRLGQLDEARQHFEQAMELFGQERAQLGLANTLSSLGDLESRLGQLDEARQHFEQAMELFGQERDQLGLANTLRSLGDLERGKDEFDAARQHYEDATRLHRDERDQLGLANDWASLGDLEVKCGRWPEARVAYETALPLYRAARDDAFVAYTLADLARVALAQGRSDDAPKLLAEAREVALRSGLPAALAYVEGMSRQLGDGRPSRWRTIFDRLFRVFQGLP